MSVRLPQSRAERLIAAGRFVLAIASFAAIYLDPLEPSRSASLTYSLLGAYAIYSLLTVVWTAIAPGTSRRAQWAGHLLDLAFFGTINQLTFGPTSPFFTYFVFSIVCAMLRFGRRGTTHTALAALGVYAASSIGHFRDADFELNRFIIRSAYLIVVASLLIYLTAYEERIQRDLARIARWPRSMRKEHDALITELMREATSIFGSRRALLAYERHSERFAFLAQWDDERFGVTRQSDETADLLLDRDRGTYVSSTALQVAPIDFDDTASTSKGNAATNTADRGLPPMLVKRYSIDEVVATPFKGDLVAGRLLLLDGPLPLQEEVNLAKIAGAVIAGRLDYYHSAEQLQRGAVAEERMRVARDLHDSVLQSLTGWHCRFARCRASLHKNPTRPRSDSERSSRSFCRHKRNCAGSSKSCVPIAGAATMIPASASAWSHWHSASATSGASRWRTKSRRSCTSCRSAHATRFTRSSMKGWPMPRDMLPRDACR
jgi:signal transduction histidine kinase